MELTSGQRILFDTYEKFRIIVSCFQFFFRFYSLFYWGVRPSISFLQAFLRKNYPCNYYPWKPAKA